MNAEFRALVIDDDELCRKFTAAILTRLGAAEVLEAEDGATALAYADSYRGQLDLVVCDLHMPRIDGLETLERLAEIAYWPHCVIASAADPRLLRASGALANKLAGRKLFMMSKPVTVEKMQEVVDTIRADDRRSDLADDHAAFEPPDCSTKLMKGIANREFAPHFLPILDIATKQIRGVQADLRWDSPAHGLLDPRNFATVARFVGLLGDLCYSIIPDAVEHCMSWRETGQDLFLKLGLPAQLLGLPDLPRRLENIVSNFGLPANRLILGIDEDAWFPDSLVAPEILTRLRVRKFGLCLDQFGGDHANLKQLLAAPFTAMSVEAAAMLAMPQDLEAAIVFRSNVPLARQLGMTVFATDIATQQQWDFVASAGYDFATGPLVARHAPADQFGNWLHARRETARCPVTHAPQLTKVMPDA